MDHLTKDRVGRLIDFCEMQDCKHYYSPIGSLDYLNTNENKALFNRACIKVYFQQFQLVPYPQKQKEFVPYMSILDTLMHCGPDGTKDILLQSCDTFEFK